jgi:hypothetical protein
MDSAAGFASVGFSDTIPNLTERIKAAFAAGWT